MKDRKYRFTTGSACFCTVTTVISSSSFLAQCYGAAAFSCSTELCGIVFVSAGGLMESESINMEGSVEVTLAPN